MSSNYEINWTWSEPHQDYYYVPYYDANGQPVYVWSKQAQTSPRDSTAGAQNPGYQQSHTTFPARYNPPQPHGGYSQQYGQQLATQAYVGQHHRGDSASYAEPNSNAAQMPPSIPQHLVPTLPGLIPGTPQRGWYEPLDSSYCMRTGFEAHQFFKKGRVFSVLWAEAASETAAKQLPGNDDGTVIGYPRQDHHNAYTTGRFGEIVFSQIRRFVIMRVKKKDHFVYACPITTYSGRATTKKGCEPKEHSIVYFRGTDPNHCYVQGEYGNGMVKEPIEIIPSNTSETMEHASRIRFGKTFPVEWNVKVKDIGKVHPGHMSKLIRYWKEEDFYDSADDEEGESVAAVDH